MKKILVLTTTYPLNKVDTQPRFVEFLSEKLAETHNVTVLAPAIKGNKGDTCIHHNIEIIRFRYFFSHFETLCGGEGILENLKKSKFLILLVPFMILAQILAAIKLCNSHKIEVIHAHWILPQGLVALICSFFLKRRVKILVTSHGGDLFALNGLFSTELKKYVLKKVSRVTVVSEAMKSFCIDQFCIQPSKIEVASMGVDLQTTFVSLGDHQLHKFVFVGRLAEKKGVDVLIAAMSILKAKGLDFTLDIVGGGSRQCIYEAIIAKEGLDGCIFFKGAVKNDQVVKFLQSASIAIFPFKVASDGDQEGLGLTMVEAMGCGCLTIASDLSAVRDVIKDHWNGLLVTSNDAKELANRVAYAVSDKCDRDTMITNARKSVVDKFDWSIVGEKYSRIIEAL